MLINGNLILGSTILKRTGAKATVTYNLTNCVSTNTAVNVSKNGTYITTLVADTSFSYVGARIIMGTKDITATCYNMSTGIVNITNVDGNITITAEKLTTFSNASWYAIKNVAQNNFASTIGWVIGDTKSLIIGDYSYTVRICDLTEHRYQYYNDTTRYSNMVLETVELFPETKQRSTSNNGNYNENTIRQFYLNDLISLMDASCSSLLETVKIPNYYMVSESTSQTSFSNDKIFMPGSTATGRDIAYEDETVYQYYNENGVSARLKKAVNGANTIIWWIRTGGWSNSSYSSQYEGQLGQYINTDGSFSSLTGTNYLGVRTINQYGVPLFWAW